MSRSKPHAPTRARRTHTNRQVNAAPETGRREGLERRGVGGGERTLVDGLEALLLLLDPVGLHELELPALVVLLGRRHPACAPASQEKVLGASTGTRERRRRVEAVEEDETCTRRRFACGLEKGAVRRLGERGGLLRRCGWNVDPCGCDEVGVFEGLPRGTFAAAAS